MHRKLKPIRDLDPLSPAERAQLWTDLDHGLAFTTAVRLLGAEHFLSIKRHKLVTWWHREKQRREINAQIPPGFHITAEDLLALMNGDAVAYNPVGIALLQKRAFDLACAPEVSATILSSLLRIFHYPKALEFTQRRLQISEQNARLKQQKFDRDNPGLSPAFQSPFDSTPAPDVSSFLQGPVPLPLEVLENNRRYAEKLSSGQLTLVKDSDGLVTAIETSSITGGAHSTVPHFNSSPTPNENCPIPNPHRDPSASPLTPDISNLEFLPSALTNTQPQQEKPVTDPTLHTSLLINTQLQLGVPELATSKNRFNGFSSASAPISPSFPSSPNLPSPICDLQSKDLQSTVDTYNIRRAHEYWAWRRKTAHPSYDGSGPAFVTAYRHCPCSHATPCPVHENDDTGGPFPTWFWSLPPHHTHYAACLAARNLPYRDPEECVPKEFRQTKP